MAVDRYSTFPPGFCFCPNDVELIEDYLKPKVNGRFNYPGRILEVSIYEHSPQELDERYRRRGEQATYFFSPTPVSNIDFWRNTGKYVYRAVGENLGFWKITVKDVDIRVGDRLIGYRKKLVYYIGTYKNPIKTCWRMKEFRLNPEENNNIIAPQNLSSAAPPPNQMQLDDLVLCKIYKKAQKLSGAKRKSAVQSQLEVLKEQGALQRINFVFFYLRDFLVNGL